MDYLRYTRYAPLKLLAAGALLLPACSQAPDAGSANPVATSRRAAATPGLSSLVRRAGFEFDAPPLPAPSAPSSEVAPVELVPAALPELARLPQDDAYAAHNLSTHSSSRSQGPQEHESEPESSQSKVAPVPEDFDAAPPSHLAQRLPPVSVEVDSECTRLPAVEVEAPPEIPSVPSLATLPTVTAPAPAIMPAEPVVVAAPRVDRREYAPPTPPVARELDRPAKLPAVEEAPGEVAPPPAAPPEAANSSISTRGTDNAIDRQAEAFVRQGISLAERGALFSARAQFIQALKLLAQSNDLRDGGTTHGQALAAGLRALKEADDFVPGGSRLDADLNVPALVAAHRTPVLKNACDDVSPVVAAQKYYTYAQEQLAVASEQEPSGSWALYALGRMHAAREASNAFGSNGRSKAMVMLQAALLVDSRNHMAANELGVLLARGGQWEEARLALEHSLAQSRRAETLQNLSTVYATLGQNELAARSRQEADAMLAQRNDRAPAPANDGDRVRWVEPKQFADTAAASDLMVPGQAAPRGPAALPAPQGGEGTASRENRSTKTR